jgi:hypothetical protein
MSRILSYTPDEMRERYPELAAAIDDLLDNKFNGRTKWSTPYLKDLWKKWSGNYPDPRYPDKPVKISLSKAIECVEAFTGKKVTIIIE